MLGVLVHRLEVVERRGGIAELADALIVFALAAAHTAEVEAQHREADLVEGVVQVVDDAVVHRAAELRVRVQDDGDWRVFFALRVVAAFEPALRAGKNHLGHGLTSSPRVGPGYS